MSSLKTRTTKKYDWASMWLYAILHISVLIPALPRILQQKQAQHVKIGALFPIYLTTFATEYERDDIGIARFLGMKMALNEINANASLLPFTELKYSLQDTNRDEGQGIFSALALAEWGSSIVIGPATSGVSKSAQLVLRKYKIPQISYSATSTSFSDKQTYPYFSRTPPADDLQAMGQVALMKYYNWTEVATFSSPGEYGASGIEAFHASAETAGITVLAKMTLLSPTRNFTDALQAAKESGARIFVMFCTTLDSVSLLEQAFFMGLTGNGYVWIGSDAATSAATWELMSGALSEDQRLEIMRGFLGMVPAYGQGTPGYQAFLQRWSEQEPTLISGECSNETDSAGTPVWMRSYEDALNISGGFDACAGIEDFRLHMPNSYSSFSYDALYLAAHALHQLIEVEGKGTVDSSGAVILSGPELLGAIRNQSFPGLTGTVQLNENGDRVVGVKYTVKNHAGTSSGLQEVGYWDVTNGYTLCDPASNDCHPVTWSTPDNSVPLDSSEVELCEPGFAFRSQPGMSVEDRGRCTLCPEGEFALGGDTLETRAGCKPCPVGTFAPINGSALCLSCNVVGAGYFQDLEGQNECKKCPIHSERRPPSLGMSIEECVCKFQFHQAEGLLNGGECEECPIGGWCAGFDQVNRTRVNVPAVPDVGFWGDPLFPTEFYECEDSRCEYGYECAPGYDGRLCYQTAHGYGNFGGILWKCPGGYRSAQATVANLALILLILLVFYFVNGFLCEFEAIDVFLKNLRVLAVASLYPLRWHGNLNPILLFFKFAMFDVDIAQPNCIVDWSFHQSFFLQLALPSFMAFTYLLPVAIKAVRRRIKYRWSWTFILFDDRSKASHKLNTAISNIVNVSQIFYPTILLMLLASFKCSRASDGKSYLDVDPTFECNTSKHLPLQIISGLALPIVLLVPLGPLGILIKGLKKDTLHTPVFLARFGGLYRRYRISYLFWEPLFLLKVTLLVGLQVYVVSQPMAQAFCTLLLNSMALAAHFYAKPFVKTRSNKLEGVMIFMSSVFIASGNLFYTSGFGKENHFALSIGLIVMLFLNLVLAVGIAIDNVQDDLAREFSGNMVKTISHKLVDESQSGANQVLVSKRLVTAIEASKGCTQQSSRTVLTGAGAIDTLIGLGLDSIATPVRVIMDELNEPKMHSDEGSSHHDSRLQEQDVDDLMVSIASSEPENNANPNGEGEHGEENGGQIAQDTSPPVSRKGLSTLNVTSALASLEPTEVFKTLHGMALKKWLLSSVGTLTIDDMDHILALDEWITPFVSDDSHTSMYTTDTTAHFWRNVEHAFPDLMEWLSNAEEDQVEVLRRVFDGLCASDVHSTSISKGGRRANYLHLIMEEDRSSIMYWLCHAPQNQRHAFFALLRKILKSQGIDTTQPGFKSAMPLMAMSQSLLEYGNGIHNRVSNCVVRSDPSPSGISEGVTHNM